MIPKRPARPRVGLLSFRSRHSPWQGVKVDDRKRVPEGMPRVAQKAWSGGTLRNFSSNQAAYARTSPGDEENRVAPSIFGRLPSVSTIVPVSNRLVLCNIANSLRWVWVTVPTWAGDSDLICERNR